MSSLPSPLVYVKLNTNKMQAFDTIMVAHPYHSILPHVNWNVCDILLSNEISFLVFHLISSLILNRN